MSTTHKKLMEFGKSFLWFLGAAVLLAQCYRLTAFYAFSVPMEMVLERDIPVSIFAFALMFLQNNLKSLIKTALKNVPLLNTKTNGKND